MIFMLLFFNLMCNNLWICSLSRLCMDLWKNKALTWSPGFPDSPGRPEGPGRPYTIQTTTNDQSCWINIINDRQSFYLNQLFRLGPNLPLYNTRWKVQCMCVVVSFCSSLCHLSLNRKFRKMTVVQWTLNFTMWWCSYLVSSNIVKVNASNLEELDAILQ